MTDKLNYKEMSRENKVILQSEQLKWIQKQISYSWKNHLISMSIIFFAVFLSILFIEKSVPLLFVFGLLLASHFAASIVCMDERTSKLVAVVEVLIEHNYDVDNTLSKLREKI